jgi:hypothetical protein
MHLMGIALKKANENIVLAAPVASRRVPLRAALSMDSDSGELIKY